MKSKQKAQKTKAKSGKIPKGTIRIGKDLRVYERTEDGWKLSSEEFPDAISVIRLFRSNQRFKELIDKKDPRFLKGQLGPDRKTQGARINILPDGKKLDGAFSLFSEELTIHDQLTQSHWDVIYKNPNGKFSYHYTLDKKKQATNHKYKEVKEFEKIYPFLEKKILKSLEDEEDYMALPIYTLLKTYMRVGNEIYYKTHKHKGLTTLKKLDITINKDNVNFKYLGKDGVPQDITKSFPKLYIERLKKLILKTKDNDFIFKTPEGKLLSENDFKKTFKKYTGKNFYPHIIRSYFATKQTEEFLKSHKKPKKEEVKLFLFSVAEELGHKKFSKKEGCWEDSYTVTIGHYIQPRLAEKIRGFC